MTTYAMVVDVTRCTGCHNCFLACRDEHVGNDHRPIAAAQPEGGQTWLELLEHERGKFPRVRVDYVPLPCQQCRDAPCVTSAAGGAVYRRPDGIVVIDPDRAKGHPEIVASCPYRVIHWNAAEEIAQKCTFCAHLLDQGWDEPRCVEACPTEALVFGDADDPTSKVSQILKSKATEALHAEFGLTPAVRYHGLPQRFVSGEIAFADRLNDPAVNVRLSLRNGTNAHECLTDPYGDFVFEGLEAGASYVLHILAPGYGAREIGIGAHHDVDLGTILLEPNGVGAA